MTNMLSTGKCVESLLKISQCVQSNSAVWEIFDSISPSESVADFQCSLDLPELVQSLRSLEKSLDDLNELRVQMKIRILGLENYCGPLLLEKHIRRMRDGLKELPDEILAGIFQAGHDMDGFGHNRFAVSVSQVSRRFRDVALHTPRLWTRFRLGDHPLQISAYVSRSSNVPALEIDTSPWRTRSGVVQSDDASSLMPGPLQDLALTFGLNNTDVSTVLATPEANVVVLSIPSITLRLWCFESNHGAQFKYLESIYSHVRFQDLIQLKMTMNPMCGTLLYLATEGLSPYPSKVENVALEIASHHAQSHGNISHLLPGITDIGELRIDTLQSSIFNSVDSVASPTARTITFKGCEWLSDDKLSQLIRTYAAESNVQSLNIIACRNVSEEFIRGNPMRARMKMSWSLH
ncbi:hypothetical protein BD410DRAFT_800790 [Rickenella mellea]|uniref:F-box domain-containing protein n=1 Tax=Rickenella mellea TaxID=50990 RepID=A0A4Y7QHA9_9AGAM|nr:hypothetical protein BD410DRAFT_800790 [Rickenella mellea]